MTSVLIVSSSQAKANALTELMSSMQKDYVIQTVSSAERTRLRIIQADYDLIVIIAPLKEEFGDRLSVEVTEKVSAGVMLIVESVHLDEISRRTEEYGVLVVSATSGKSLLRQAIQLVLASHRRLVRLKEQNVKLQNKLRVEKEVARAKLVLIQNLKMTEAEAHRYIEKQAMDLRLSKREIAENILKIYET